MPVTSIGSGTPPADERPAEDPPNARRSSSSARSATTPAAATAESRRVIDADDEDAPSAPVSAPASAVDVVSPPRVSMGSSPRRSGGSVASHSGSFAGGLAGPATPCLAAAARAASRDASRSVLSTSCRLRSFARRSAFSLASFAFHRALLSRMYARTSAFRRSDSSRRLAASRASDSGAGAPAPDADPDAEPGRRIPARQGLFASRSSAFRAARASAVSPGRSSSGAGRDAAGDPAGAADGGRNTADVASTSASSPEREGRLARVPLCLATRSASLSMAACRLARSSSASAAAFRLAAASANASLGGGSATSTMAAAPSSSPSSSAACAAMRERSSERASMWADLASRSGLGRAGDLEGAAGTLDESHGLSEMGLGLGGGLAFALPEPDARDARWRASGGVGGSIAPSFAAASAAASAARMPTNRTPRRTREGADARNADSPGAPRRRTSNDRERAPATPTTPFALRARASGGRTLSPETRAACVAYGGGRGAVQTK